MAHDLEAVRPVEPERVLVVLAHGQHHRLRKRQHVLQERAAAPMMLVRGVHAEAQQVEELAVPAHDGVRHDRMADDEHPARRELALEHQRAHGVVGEECVLEGGDAQSARVRAPLLPTGLGHA